jgi:hypothetical protein
MLPDPPTSESMLISCGVNNQFVLVQNVMVDQVSREYYISYLKETFVAYMMYSFVRDMFSHVVYGN